jgi:hypothetical protein
VLTAKARGSRVEVQAVGLHSKRLWTKLLKPNEFDGSIRVTQVGRLAALDCNPTHFRLAAEAHRIRLAFQYDPHFAVSVSQVDPLPHQMDAVYTHLLTQPRIRFLIADDPGAGKTIMGGLTIKELKFRGLVERILIVTPANLTDQWRRELHDKFNESFTVINRGDTERPRDRAHRRRGRQAARDRPGPQAGVGGRGELRLGLDLAAGGPGGPLHRGQGASGCPSRSSAHETKS